MTKPWSVEGVEVEPSRVVGVRRHVTFGVDNLGEIIGDLYGIVYGAPPADGGEAVGGNVIVYVPDGDRTADMLVGREWEGNPPEGLEAYDLPACRAGHTRHVGPYTELPEAHGAIHSWMHEQGHRAVGLNWEVYGDWDDDPAKLVTDVYYLLS